MHRFSFSVQLLYCWGYFELLFLNHYLWEDLFLCENVIVKKLNGCLARLLQAVYIARNIHGQSVITKRFPSIELYLSVKLI